MVNLGKLKLNDSNPRFIKDDKFEKLCKSIQETPNLLSKVKLKIDFSDGGKVLGGNMRLRALTHLKYKEIPESWIEDCSDLTDEEKRKLIIIDNASFGAWDFDLLANEWDTEELDSWGIDIPNFENPKLIASDDEFEGSIDKIETDIVLGDLIEIGENRLLCGDSTNFNDVEKLLDGNVATISFTDPPHDFTDEQHQEVFNNCIAFSTGDIFILSANDKLINLAYENKDVFNDFLVHDFVFHIGGGHAPLRQFDLIAHFRKTKFYNMNDGFSNCIRVNSMRMGGYVKEKVHDHQKHIDLYAAFYNHYSVEGDSVLDLFGGSGTAIAAAHQLKRKSYVIEFNPLYCQLIVDRMKKLDKNLIIKKNGELWHTIN